jgi:hypothetical protein
MTTENTTENTTDTAKDTMAAMSSQCFFYRLLVSLVFYIGRHWLSFGIFYTATTTATITHMTTTNTRDLLC